MIFESSLRVDRNDFVRKTLLQPRLIINWVPRPTTKFSGGWGLYYQPVYLALIAQSYDQERIDVLGSSTAAIVTSFSSGVPLNQPYFQTASAEWQHDGAAARHRPFMSWNGINAMASFTITFQQILCTTTSNSQMPAAIDIARLMFLCGVPYAMAPT